MSFKNTVLSSLRWTLFAKFGSQLVSWACTLVVMRLLHPDDYGLMAMATALIALCVLINEMGLGQAVVQAKTIATQELKQVFGLVVLINGSLSALLCLTAPAVAAFFGEPRLTAIIMALAAQFLILMFMVIPSALLDREMLFRYKSINEVLATVTGAAVTLSMAWLGYGVWALVVGSLATVTVRTVCLNLQKPFLHRPSFDFGGFGHFLRFGGYTTANRVLWYLYSQADVFVIGRLLGKTQLGFYSVGMQLASLPLQKVGAVLNQVGHAAYSRMQDERERERVGQYVVKAARIMAFVSFPVFFGLSAVTPELIYVVGGTQWLPAILPMQLLSLVFPLRAMNLTLTPVVSGLGRPDITLRTLLIAVVVMPSSFYLGGMWDGLRGVCLAWVVIFPLWSLYAMKQSLKLIALPLRAFLSAARWPALLAGTMYGAVSAGRWGLSELHELPRLLLLGALGAAVYAGLFWTLRRQECRELLGSLKQDR